MYANEMERHTRGAELAATDLRRGIGFEPGPRQIGGLTGPAGPARTDIDAQSRRPVSRTLRCRFE